MLKNILTFVFLIVSLGVNAQGTIKTMFYNLLEFPSAQPNNREQILMEILDEYEPDLFMICELESEFGADLILDTSPNSNKKVFEAEVLESSVIDETVLKKVLLLAGRAIAYPALEGYELIMDNSTPLQVKFSIIGALSYLILPLDLIPDFIPATGFSDDLVALTAVISLWKNHITPEIKFRAQCKLNKWFQI